MKVRILDVTDSSHIEKAVYLPEALTLYVEFKSGSIYRYDQVKPELFGRLAAADSVGAEFSESIRFNPNIPYTKVKEMPGGENER